MVRCLLALLIAYWAIFSIYTTVNLVTGGPEAAVRWYEHFQAEGSALIQPWDWKLFCAQQAVIVVATVFFLTLVLHWRREERHAKDIVS